jgi:hypothetical protein
VTAFFVCAVKGNVLDIRFSKRDNRGLSVSGVFTCPGQSPKECLGDATFFYRRVCRDLSAVLFVTEGEGSS